MIVVVPLRAIAARRDPRAGVEQRRTIVVILQHQMQMTAGLGGKRADAPAEFVQHCQPAGLCQRVNGVEAQSVEAVVTQPVHCVLDRKALHLVDRIVDRHAPRGRRLLEKLRRVAAEVISLRSEVIVDDVEKHHDVAQMRCIDEVPEVVGRAVAVVGRVPEHAVVAPVVPSGKIVDRHQFDGGDTGVSDVIELVDQRPKRACLREGADVTLEQHGFVPGPAPPTGGTPGEGIVVDDLARAGNVVRLKGRRRIGNLQLIVDHEAVACARAGAGHIRGEPAVV